ncbi:MAG: 1-acyl-sn-glycerol-3-phosphate acyltransferase [Bacteroidales bacterium]|nr:1-acyl-sn-glycerol-3-phosphate acyltransferase [Bacteroidales bacterium]
MSEKILQIDVEKVLREKAPALARKLPRFAISLLKKIIHQEGINTFLRARGHLKGVEFATSMIDYWGVTIRVEGLENLPKNGSYIFASNHPLGGLDGVALTSIVGEKFDHKVKFVVNDILMNVTNFDTVFVPVNKHGAQAKDAADIMHNMYSSDLQVMFFPAGLVSRWQNGHIEDLEWKKSFIAKAVQYQRDVIPVYFGGKNTRFFYGFAYFRKLLGIKVNLEMLLLPRELFKQMGKTFTVRFGEPIPWQTFDKSKSARDWATKVKKATYLLEKKKK